MAVSVPRDARGAGGMPAPGRRVRPDVPAPDLVAAARRLADDVLAPGAAAVDAGTVRREDLDAIGAAGLLGAATAAPATFRAVQEVLAGADAATWFVQVQHHHLVRQLTEPPPALADLREDLVAGRVLSGVAFSHLRRREQRPVRATRVDGGWRLDGHVPWCTGWGLADVLALGGATDDDRVVFVVVDARPGPAVTASEPMRLAVLQAAQTVQLDVDGLVLPDERALEPVPYDAWARADARTTVSTNPAVLGIAQAAVDRLRGLGGQRSLAEAVDVAGVLGDRLDDLRRRAYALADDPSSDPGEALATRVRAQRLCLDATGALVAAGAGGSMLTTDPAQRWAREAAFLTVQGQTLPARRAALTSYLPG